MHCGLLGKKLGHSYSPQIHSFLGSYSYSLFEKTSEQLPAFLKDGDFTGLNVTIPYKKEVIPYCAELSATAQKLGAVNTIVRRPDGSLIGHNTDYFGFQSLIKRSGINVGSKKVLVLGSGGASVTAVAVLEELGAEAVVISRNGENHYGNLHLHRDAAVIVNTTPVGMYPDTGVSPVCLDDFPNLQGVLDVVYNPARTQLLLDAESHGLVAHNGLWMLVAQAKESAEWFTGSRISNDVIESIYHTLRRQMENIVLIGMPGCGKSTIGKLLAEKTNRVFKDADQVIEETAGKSIPSIFAEAGEQVFRDFESSVLRDLGKESGLVIATGGGCVTRSCNYPSLHQNGTIYWLERDVASLPTDGRPLSHKDTLRHMYQIRQPLYAAFADHSIENHDCIENAVMRILNQEGYV